MLTSRSLLWAPGFFGKPRKTLLRVVPSRGKEAGTLIHQSLNVQNSSHTGRSCGTSPQGQRHTDLRSESGSRSGEGRGDGGGVSPMALLCQIPGTSGGALAPFPLLLLVGLGLEDAAARAPGPLVRLHAHLLRHLTPREKESGVAAQFGEVRGGAFGTCNQAKAKLSERKEG